MTIQEKLAIIYAKLDCGNRRCENCLCENFCHSSVDLRDIVREIQTEIKTIVEKEKANEQEK